MTDVRAAVPNGAARGVYVTALEPGSGKSTVVLGAAELLSRRAGRLAFLRPLVGSRPDPDTELVRERYRLAPERVVTLRAGTQRAGSAGALLDAYHSLAAVADVVLVEGSDFTGPSLPAELDLNIEAANHLGCAVLLVVGGRGRSGEQVLAAVRQDLAALTARGCVLLGVVANRVEPAAVAQVRAGLAEVVGDLLAAVLPEVPMLAAPTVAEVAAALGAQVLTGAGEPGREVSRLVVGAMGLPRFLERIADGDLVITPADRADIVAGTLAAHLCGDYPSVSGLLLTGGAPDPAIARLVAGLGDAGIPVVAVESDTYSAATAASAVRGALSGDRKIECALRLFSDHVDGDALLAGVAVDRPVRTTPLVFEHALIERAHSVRRHVVLPEGDDDRVLRAADQLLDREVAELTVLGRPDAVRARAAALGLRLVAGERPDLHVVDPQSSPERDAFARTYVELRRHRGVHLQQATDLMTDPSYFGTMMVHRGLADGMVSGAAHTTAHTIRPAFEFIRTAPGVSVVSGAFLMCLADRVLVYADCAVIPEPDAGQLADIAIASAATAVMFGIEPRIAMLSYSTGESGTGARVDEVRQATALVRERRPDLAVEGPLQYDAAVDPSVAAAKLPGSAVAGRATVFVFPDLNTGNNTYKAVQRSAGAVAIGPVLQGLAKPVNDLSRGATVTDIVNTVAITAVQAASAP